MANRRVDTGIVCRGASYSFTVPMGLDVNGKQIRKYMTWTPPEKMTERKADKMAKEEYINFKNRCNGLSAFNENMRFKELAEEYFKVCAPNKLKPGTAYSYKKMCDLHFMNYFGNKKLKTITTGMLSDFFCKLTTVKKGKVVKMAPLTVKKIFTIMQSLMSFAISQGYIKESPCRGVILPGKDSTKEEKRKFLTEEELPIFLELFNGYSVLNASIKTLLYTGMRAGEMLGLQWSDVDFENKRIYINHTLSQVGGKNILTTPKTKTSRRIIFMSDGLCEMLKEHKKRQHELAFKLKGNFAHPEMVFTSELGNYKNRNSLNSSFRKRLKGTGFEFLTLHCLRHSNATLLLNEGVDLKVVSEHLGHSDVSTTGNIYANVLERTKKKTADIIALKIAQ